MLFTDTDVSLIKVHLKKKKNFVSGKIVCCGGNWDNHICVKMYINNFQTVS